ncbi:hypothetical protein BJX62DRAFT_65870 [Aspergillus germanicus]
MTAAYSKPVLLGKGPLPREGQKGRGTPGTARGCLRQRVSDSTDTPAHACELNAPEASVSVEASDTTDTPVSTTDIVATIAETIELHNASIAKGMKHLNSRPSEPSIYTLESGLTITIHCGRKRDAQANVEGGSAGLRDGGMPRKSRNRLLERHAMMKVTVRATRAAYKTSYGVAGAGNTVEGLGHCDSSQRLLCLPAYGYSRHFQLQQQSIHGHCRYSQGQ